MSELENKQVTIFMVGDSTMADKADPERNPEHGWGQLLPTLFDSRVQVRNLAVNGRSSKSFLAEGWAEVCAALRPGDEELVLSLGPERSKELYLWLEP